MKIITCAVCGQPKAADHTCPKPAGYWAALGSFLGVVATQRGLPPCGGCDKPLEACTCNDRTSTR
jgi:hypothetical protein